MEQTGLRCYTSACNEIAKILKIWRMGNKAYGCGGNFSPIIYYFFINSNKNMNPIDLQHLPVVFMMAFPRVTA